MKKLLLTSLTAICLFAIQAVANDGGSAYIDVKGIAPKGADHNTEIKVYGKDAADFMRLLPADEGVIYGMVPKEVAAQIKSNERSLTLISKGWALSFNCAAGKLDVPNYDYSRATYVTTTPECTVKLIKVASGEDYHEYLGDAFKMQPKDYEKNMCTQE
jgi:hypothetical protein